MSFFVALGTGPKVADIVRMSPFITKHIALSDNKEQYGLELPVDKKNRYTESILCCNDQDPSNVTAGEGGDPLPFSTLDLNDIFFIYG